MGRLLAENKKSGRIRGFVGRCCQLALAAYCCGTALSFLAINTYSLALLGAEPPPANAKSADLKASDTKPPEPASSDPKSQYTPEQLSRVDERDHADEQKDQFLREGKFAAAVAASEKIVAIDREVLGDNHCQFFMTLEWLAKLQALNDNQAAAQKSLVELSALQSKGLGAGGSRTVEAHLMTDYLKRLSALDDKQRENLRQAEQLNAQVIKLGDDGKFKEALPLASEALEIRKTILGPESFDTISSLNNVGWCQRELGDYKQAESTLRDVLQRRRKIFGEEHPDVGLSNNTLGWLYLKQRDFKSAEPFFRRAADIYINAVGESDENYLTSLGNLGELYVRAADYRRALALRSQVVNIRRQFQSKNEKSYADSLRLLAIVNEYLHEYDKAEAALNEALPIFKRSSGDDSRDCINCIGDLEYCYEETGDYEKSLPLYQQTLDSQRRVLGLESSEVGITLYHISSIYIAKKDYSKALEPTRQALEIFRKSSGEKDDKFKTSQDNVAWLLGQVGYECQQRDDFAGARKAYDEKLDIDTQRFGEKHWQVTDDRHSLAYVDQLEKMTPAQRAELAEAQQLYFKAHSSKQLKMRKAIGPAEKALEIDRRLLGDEHPQTIGDLFEVGYLYKEMGEYAKAEPIYHQLPDLCRKVFGDSHPNYYVSLHNLANLYESHGDVSKTEAAYEQALEVARKVYGEQDVNVARTISSLAVLNDDLGRLGKAETLYKQALEIYKNTVGQHDPDYADGLLRLGGFYTWSLHDYAKAEPLLREAANVYKSALGDKDPAYTRAIDYLATLYMSTEHFDRAEPLRQQALAIRKEVFGEKHPDYADSLNKLGLFYLVMGDYPKAEPLLQQALEIDQEIYGKSNAIEAVPLTNLSDIYLYTNQYEKSESTARQALELYRHDTGTQTENYADGLMRLAVLARFTGHPENGVPLAREAVQIGKSLLEQNATFQSERQQLAIRNKVAHLVEGYMDVTSNAATPADSVYADLADWKGIVGARQQQLRRLHRQLQQSGNKDAINLEAELQDATRALAEISHTSSPQAPDLPFRRQELSDKIETLQQQFAEASAGAQLSIKKVSLDDVRAALPADVVLVDFMGYRRYAPEKKKRGNDNYENMATAFVVRSGQSVVRIELGPADTIDGAIQTWRTHFGHKSGDVDPGAQLRQLVWQPLEKFIKSARTVLISPNGLMAPMAWAALPGAKPGTFLIDEVSIGLIPIPRLLPELLAGSGQDSGQSNVSPNAPSLLLVGDVDFGAEPGSADLLAIDRTVPRGGEPFNWPSLPGTRDEVASIQTSFVKQFHDAQPTVLVRDQATKNAVSDAMTRCEYIHFSTHGFFAPAKTTPVAGSVANSDADSEGGFVTTQEVSGYQPGLLSGLVLVGANRLPASGKENGILTALEVEEMDLHQVKLATLSACETGLGQTAGGEGLLGLQRSLPNRRCENCSGQFMESSR